MKSYFLSLLILFMCFTGISQNEQKVIRLIESGDIEALKLEINAIRAELFKRDRPLVTIIIVKFAPVSSDNPEAAQLFIDSLGTIKLADYDFNHLKASFIQSSLECASFRMLNAYYDAKLLPKKAIESILKCDFCDSDDTFMKRSELDYLKTIEVLINKGYKIKKNTKWIDFYFKNSKCQGSIIPEYLLKIGCKASDSAQAKLDALKIENK